jgi:hypothetical protein
VSVEGVDEDAERQIAPVLRSAAVEHETLPAAVIDLAQQRGLADSGLAHDLKDPGRPAVLHGIQRPFDVHPYERVGALTA